MNQEHLNEEQLQLYAERPELMESVMQLHLAHCEVCAVKVQNYEAILKGIEKLSLPSFDFDLTEVAMASLPKKEVHYPWSALIAACVGIIIIGLFFFLFGNSLGYLFDQLSSVSLYLITIPMLVFAVFRSGIMAIDYLKRLTSIQHLN